MVYCYTPYPSCFQGHRNLLLSAVNSGPARYERLVSYHPGIRDRINKSWALGYPPYYPLMLFRCEYILEFLNYHLTILDFEELTSANVKSLTEIMAALKKVHMVSLFSILIFS